MRIKFIVSSTVFWFAMWMVSAETFIFQPGPEGKDAYVQGAGSSQKNFGDSGSLKIQENPFNQNGTFHFLTYLQFDLTQLPPIETLNSATLKLKATGGWAQGGTGDGVKPWGIYPVLEAWDESLITYFKQPKSEAKTTIIHNCGLKPETGWLEFDITQLVHDWREGKRENHGFKIRSPNINPDTHLAMASSDNAEVAHRPILELDFAPATITSLLIPKLAHLPTRTWTTEKGASLEARLAEIIKSTAILITPEGGKKRVSYLILSASDKAYIQGVKEELEQDRRAFARKYPPGENVVSSPPVPVIPFATGNRFRLHMKQVDQSLGQHYYRADQRIHIAGMVFTLQINSDKPDDRQFSLISKETNSVYGPFDYRAEEEIRIGSLNFVLQPN